MEDHFGNCHSESDRTLSNLAEADADGICLLLPINSSRHANRSGEHRTGRRRAAAELTRGHSWLSCEPLILSSSKEDGHLEGGSKPTFQPHPDNAAAAALEGLPDGTILDLIKILCKLSESHAIDWEISHDYSDGPIGFIRNGVCDGAVLTQAEGLASAIEMFGDTMDEFDQPNNI